MSDRIAVMDERPRPPDRHARPRSMPRRACRFVADFMGANVLPGALGRA